MSYSTLRIAAVVTLALLPLLPGSAAAHDPRTTARTLAHSLEVEGAGKLVLQYKALHFNEPLFAQAKASPDFMAFLNAQIWGRMGHASLAFDLRTDELDLASGDYEFGINMTSDEKFSVVFWQDDKKHEIPLEIAKNDPVNPYLSIVLLATEYDDTFVLEARCGPFRGTVDVMVPYLDPEHDDHH